MQAFRIFVFHSFALLGGLLAASVTAEPVVQEKPVATGQQVANYIKASDPSSSGAAKLVFINGCGNEGELHYIDYAESAGAPTVHTISAAGGNARVPVISPDGKWVVYAVGDGAEGHLKGGASTAYACRLTADAVPVKIAEKALEPRFALNQTDPHSMIVIYGTAGDQEVWNAADPGKTMKVSIDVSGESPVVGTPEVLYDHASMMGGLSWDERYLATAGGLGAMVDLQSGQTTVDTISLRFPRKPISGTYPEGTTAQTVLSASRAAELGMLGQTCNPSISSSRGQYTNCMSALDFGASTINDLINDGKPWDRWQILWVFDHSGAVRYHFRVPFEDPRYPYGQTMTNDWTQDTALNCGSTKWHHPEWSNHPYFAVSAVLLYRAFGQNEDGGWRTTEDRHERIYLVDLKRKDFLCLISPTDADIRYAEQITHLKYPGLWIDIADEFQEESDWLENASDVKHSRPAPMPRGITVSSSGIASSAPLASAELFLPNGVLIKRIAVHGATRIGARELTTSATGASTCILRLTTSEGRRIVFPRLIMK